MVKPRREMVLNILKKGQRYDGRALDVYRPIEIQKGVLSSAEGSALALLGKTKVLVAIKFGELTPFPDRPQEGVLMANAELLPLASPRFEPGPPREDSIELARGIDRGIRSAEIVDLKSFFIEEGKVLGMFIDIWVLDHSGNFIDAAGIAAAAALTDTKMPKVEDGKIVRGETTGPLPIKAKPLPVTSIKIGPHWLVDPLLEEEQAQETRLTISTTENNVCAIQKGGGRLTAAELEERVDIAFKRGAEIRKLL